MYIYKIKFSYYKTTCILTVIPFHYFASKTINKGPFHLRFVNNNSNKFHCLNANIPQNFTPFLYSVWKRREFNEAMSKELSWVYSHMLNCIFTVSNAHVLCMHPKIQLMIEYFLQQFSLKVISRSSLLSAVFLMVISESNTASYFFVCLPSVLMLSYSHEENESTWFAVFYFGPFCYFCVVFLHTPD